jgi:hypothetical protein
MNYENKKSNKLKAKIKSDKEKKEYEEKIRIMQNHILAMKRQQEDVDKKINFLKHKEENINNVKKEKEINKKAIMELNNLKRNELEKKRKNIEKQREILNKGMKESTQKAKMDKINNYKQLQKEREEVNIKAKDINKKNSYSIKNNIEKIKNTRENNKNYQMKRKKILNKNYNDLNEQKAENNLKRTELLKMQMMKLQTEENECLEKLNRTKERLNNYSSTERIYYYGKPKNKKARKHSDVES